jgi:hypothetical protein
MAASGEDQWGFRWVRSAGRGVAWDGKSRLAGQKRDTSLADKRGDDEPAQPSQKPRIPLTESKPNQLVVKLDPSTGIGLVADARRADNALFRP